MIELYTIDKVLVIVWPHFQKGLVKTVGISQNYQFSSLEPMINVITQVKVLVTSKIRTITGTSAGGNETSFIDQI